MKIPKASLRRRRKRFIRHDDGRKTDFSFSSREERSMIYTYLLNMIKAGYAKDHTGEIFSFCVDVIGEKNAYLLIKSLYPTKIDYSNADDLYYWAASNIPDWETLQIVHDVFMPKIESLLQENSGRRNTELLIRLKMVQDIFKLSDEEVTMLMFFYLVDNYSTVSRYLGQSPLDLTIYNILRVYGPMVLGIKGRDFRSMLSKTILFDADIIDIRGGRSLDNRICDYLLGIGERDLRSAFFSKDSNTPLLLKDFSLAQEEIGVMEALFKSNGGCNVLFYGAPGTGKTSLAKALAKHMKVDLFSVRISGSANDYDDDDMGFRLKALYATINSTRRCKCLILIDEADELLNAAVMPHVDNRTNKSWINNLLDSHDRKIIWITNRRWGIDASTMRRFAFSLEFEQLTAKNRVTILEHALKTEGLKNYLADKDIQDLCKTYHVDAGGIVNAVRLLKIEKSTPKESVVRMVEAVLKNHEKATDSNGSVKARRRKKDFSIYSLESLNTSHDLDEISQRLKEFNEAHEGEGKKSFSMLLYGPPGTGNPLCQYS